MCAKYCLVNAAAELSQEWWCVCVFASSELTNDPSVRAPSLEHASTNLHHTHKKQHTTYFFTLAASQTKKNQHSAIII